MRTRWMTVLLLGLLLLLTNCGTQEPRGQTPETPTGFEFVVDPEAGRVELVSHQGGLLVPAAEDPRVLVPGTEIELAYYRYAFLPGNILEIHASFRNTTPDSYFVAPFSFTPSQTPAQGNYLDSTEPDVDPRFDFGNGSLRPGEVTRENCGSYCTESWFTFSVTHKGQRFGYFVNANAVVTDLLGVVGAGEPLLQNGKQLFLGNRLPPDVEDPYGCGFTLLRYLPGGSLDPTFGTGGVTATTFYCSSTSVGAGLQSDQHIVVVGSASWLGSYLHAGVLARYTPDGQELLKRGLALADRTAVTGFEILPDDMVVIVGWATGSIGGNFRWYFTSDLSSFGVLGNLVSLTVDGKTVYGGHNGGGDASLVRHDSDNTLDTGFGSDGFVTIDVGGRDDISTLTLQPDDSLLATGHTSACPTPSGEWINFSVVVYPDGTYDPPACLY